VGHVCPRLPLHLDLMQPVSGRNAAAQWVGVQQQEARLSAAEACGMCAISAFGQGMERTPV
jgi:hypothetical protein